MVDRFSVDFLISNHRRFAKTGSGQIRTGKGKLTLARALPFSLRHPGRCERHNCAQGTEALVKKRKENAFLRHFELKTIHLPRQARDKHRESTQKRKLRFCRDECLLVFSSGKGPRLLRHLNIKRSFYQDRLGTNIGKAQKETTRFLIDNGAPGSGSNFPLRGYKLSNFEGGTRVAAIVSGGLLPVAVRGKVADGLAGIYDWSATFFALAVRKRSIIVFHFRYYK
jgi:hypothetical protein